MPSVPTKKCCTSFISKANFDFQHNIVHYIRAQDMQTFMSITGTREYNRAIMPLITPKKKKKQENILIK